MFFNKILVNIYVALCGILMVVVGATGNVGYNEKYLLIVFGAVMLLMSVALALIHFLDWELYYGDIFDEIKKDRRIAKYAKLEKKLEKLKEKDM